ncbi:hypothetical protein PFISCL1PPCAC_1930, partial [Pristionchus fissidentatus]
SDLEIILEDEVNDDDVVVLDKKNDVNTTVATGGINDGYWNKCRILFLPTLGIDGMLSIQDTIKASIALLMELNDTLFTGSLLYRLRSAVVSGASVLTEKHICDTSKRTAYYALTTLNGYGFFPRGFLYLCINLLRDDREKIRAVIEPFKKIISNMKGQLTFISKCSEKRLAKNAEMRGKCKAMQEMTDRYIIWQYPTLFSEVDNEKWPEFVKTAIRENEERREGKRLTRITDEKTPWDRYSKEKMEKLKNKMVMIQQSQFWKNSCSMWGLKTEVDGESVVNAAIKISKEIDRLYGGNLISKCRIVSKSICWDDKDLFDPTRHNCLRFLELIDRYSVFPKGIYILCLKAVVLDESLLDPCIELLAKIKDKVNEN